MDERTYGWTNGHRDGLTDIGTDKIQYGDASTHLIRENQQLSIFLFNKRIVDRGEKDDKKEAEGE